jgi:predicted RNase H-like HicB family nuclease
VKTYRVAYERDEAGWWVARVRGVAGVHTQARNIETARRRVREALSLAIGDAKAEAAVLVDEVKLPSSARRKVAALKRAVAKEAQARDKLHEAARLAALALTKDLHMSRRDAAKVTGYSFQRIQQLVEKHS